MAGLATRAVHGRPQPDGGLSTPIQRSATFLYPELPDGSPAPYMYTRYTNPTLEAVESTLASLEGADGALLFASGLGAASTIVHALLDGGTIAVQEGIYGGTTALLAEEMGPRAKMVSAGKATPRVPAEADVVWMESITNPLLRVADVRKWAEAAHAVEAVLVVDATFATPALQRPLELGADVVMHSATKYLGGHSDLVAGCVAWRDPELGKSLWKRRRNLGACIDPHGAWLVERGMKTLELRMERQCANAHAMALAAMAAGVETIYPGLESHPDHAVAKTLDGFGGMLTIDLRSREAAIKFRRSVRVMRAAASLGGVESLASLPMETSHAYSSDEERAAMGIGDGLVRISVGIENEADLVEDMAHALEVARG